MNNKFIDSYNNRWILLVGDSDSSEVDKTVNSFKAPLKFNYEKQAHYNACDKYFNNNPRKLQRNYNKLCWAFNREKFNKKKLRFLRDLLGYQAFEKEKSDELEQYLNYLVTDLITHFKSLGADLSDRLLPNKFIHFFSPWEYIKIFTRHWLCKDETLHALGHIASVSWGRLDIFIRDMEDDNINTATLVHELTHQLGNKIFLLANGLTPELIKNGYHQKYKGTNFIKKEYKEYTYDDFLLFDEGLTDYITRDYFIKKNLENLYTDDSSYNNMVKFIKRLFKDLALKTGDEEKIITDQFMLSYFTGDIKPIELLREYYGNEDYELIANLENSRDISLAIKRLGF